MHLRDLGLKPGADVEIGVRAVDGAGNVGPAATAQVRVSSKTAAPLPGRSPQPFTETSALPRLGGAEVAILDELDKVHPVTGEMIPKQADGYLAANHLWSAKDKFKSACTRRAMSSSLSRCCCAATSRVSVPS